MSGFGQLLRQASNGDMSQLQQLAKDSTVMYIGFQHRLLNTNPGMATQKHIALYASGFRFSRQLWNTHSTRCLYQTPWGLFYIDPLVFPEKYLQDLQKALVVARCEMKTEPASPCPKPTAVPWRSQGYKQLSRSAHNTAFRVYKGFGLPGFI